MKLQLDWLDKQTHQHWIVIAGKSSPIIDYSFISLTAIIEGNHDLLLNKVFADTYPQRFGVRPGHVHPDLNWGSIIYLQDKVTTVGFPSGRQLQIYGSPRTAQSGHWAFQYPETRDIFAGAIPSGTDIFVTHGPPKYHLDTFDGRARGCPHLLRERDMAVT